MKLLLRCALAFVLMTSLLLYKNLDKLALMTHNIIFGHILVNDYSLELSADGSELTLKGGIASGITKKLSDIIENNKKIDTITLDSTGGDIYEAIKLYSYIYHKNLNTVVNNNCITECVVAFVGGRNRWLGFMGHIGFYPPDMPLPVADGYEPVFLSIITTYRNISTLLDKLFATVSRSKINASFPSRNDLIRLHYLTSRRSEAASSKRIIDEFFFTRILDIKRHLPTKDDDDTYLVNIEVENGSVIYTFEISNRKFDAIHDNESTTNLFIKKSELELCGNTEFADGLQAGLNYKFIYIHNSTPPESITVNLDRCD